MGYFNNLNNWGLILGGSSGLGFATAQKMASEGMNLIILHRDRRSAMSEIEKRFDTLRAFDVRIEVFNVDAVSDIKINALVNTFFDLINGAKIKLLVHSIAKGNLKSISKNADSLKKDDFLITIESMGISLYSWAQALLKNNLFEEDARIISFTSEGSSRVQPNYAAVSAAKSALESISRSLALELAPYNIKANCLQPGTTDTQALRMIPNHQEIIDYSLLRNPYQRLTLPEDVANVVFLMTMKESGWINGTVIPVNGGEHLR